MNKSIQRAIRHDCNRWMWSCYLSYSVCVLLAFLVPTLSAWLVGDMADYLLALDAAAINSRMGLFLLAVFLGAVVVPFSYTLDDLLIVRQAGRYESFLIDRLLHRPVVSLKDETGATVAEHTMVDTPDYYFIQFCKWNLPVLLVVYGGTLAVIFFRSALHGAFAVGIALLAAIPMLRTALISKLNARVSAETRAYETHRSQEEEAMFSARAFLRTNHLAEDCVKQFRGRFEDWYAACCKQKTYIAATKVVFEYLCSYGSSLAVIFLGAILVMRETMSVGALMTGYLILPTISSFYRTLASRLEEIRREQDSAARLTVFYGENEDDLTAVEKDLPTVYPTAARLRLNNVTFAYPGGEGVLHGYHEEFSANSTVRIVGENGSGKSTLVRLLSGLYAPNDGAVTDEAGSLLTKEQLRRLVTIWEQDGAVFQGTVWDNLFTSEENRGKAQKMLDKFGFGKPLAYSVSARAANLSPGERQKLLAARALLRESTFFIADEPLNHMDVAGGEVLLQYLRERTGVIVISHQEMPMRIERIVSLQQ